MKNITFFAIVGFYCLILCSCASVHTSASLRPELSNNDVEIWEIYGGGNAYASYDKVYRNIKKEAAQKSNAEGKDCFVMLGNEAKTYSYTNSITTTETMYGRANSYYGSTNYSYQVPVTETYSYSKPTSSWYVTFHTSEECKNLKNTKWRERIWYNDEVIEKAKSEEKNEAKGGIFVFVMIFVILVAVASD